MINCEHNDFDEYFGKCQDCQADRKQVIADEFRNELQAVYGKMQQALGIESGDIAPEQFFDLEQREIELASVIGQWLNSVYESEE